MFFLIANVMENARNGGRNWPKRLAAGADPADFVTSGCQFG
jgi:hypothetical protein